MISNNENTEEVKPANILPLVRIPNNLLGKVLDHGRASAYAAHLLAIKCSKGAGFVLNEKHVARQFKISRRRFQAGMRILKKTGVLDRFQIGRRSYAKETLADQGRNYVVVTEALLTSEPAQVAFVLAANLSPVPLRPADIAMRLGIKARNTISRISRAAIKAGDVASSIGPRGAVIVARRGFNFDLLKNEPTKIEPTKIDPAHSRQEEDTESCPTINSSVQNLQQATLSGEIGPVDDDLKRGDVGLLVLHDWRTCKYAKELGLDYFKPEIDETSFVARWRRMLEWQGQHPAHLRTHRACRQAVDLAMFLSKSMERDDVDCILEAVAFHLCRAHARGKVIRSIGFVAQELIRAVENENFEVLYDIPTQLPEAEFTAAAGLAHEAVAALETFGIDVNRPVLLSTQQIEELSGLVRDCGRDVLVAAINYATSSGMKPTPGKSISAWSWFDRCIRAVLPSRAGGRR
jgi:hypothetical protein